jgi:Protein of unknown function (DUF2793)
VVSPILGLGEYTNGEISYETLNINNRIIEGLLSRNVQEIRSSPTGIEADGTRYIVSGSGSGLFTGYGGAIAINIGGAWYFMPASGLTGQRVYVQASQNYYEYSGSSWVISNPTSNNTFTSSIVSYSTDSNLPNSRIIVVSATVGGLNLTLPIGTTNRECYIRNIDQGGGTNSFIVTSTSPSFTFNVPVNTTKYLLYTSAGWSLIN